MTNPHIGAELIPFDQVQRLVQERRQQRRAVNVEPLAGDLTAARTSQVRRLLAEQRGMRPPTGPDVA